ncbi:MAG: hypothetical protein AAF226_12650, partial [Verrucomicrobiota bacterium]
SASMRAFKEPLVTNLKQELPKLSRGALTIEYTALDSNLSAETLYNGTELDELISSLDAWLPFRPAHDPSAALRVARSLVGPSGTIVYVTDHEVSDLGYDARLLAIGENINNVCLRRPSHLASFSA